MKLSEAMMLGSVTCKMIPGDWNSCGLGCAGNAVGLVGAISSSFRDPRVLAIFKTWPWLIPAESSYLGSHIITSVDGTYYAGLIARKFDLDVCAGKMTFDQLVDYVRSIEPACGECNRFECACKPAEVPAQEFVHAEAR